MLVTLSLNVCVCVRPPASSLQRALVRISCPLDTTSSVSMPPIDGRIDPLFDCLDNLCEFQHNASHSGFKGAHAGLLVSVYLLKRARALGVPERSFFRAPGASTYTAREFRWRIIRCRLLRHPEDFCVSGRVQLRDLKQHVLPYLPHLSCQSLLRPVYAAVTLLSADFLIKVKS